jgi:hypothetical protein
MIEVLTSILILSDRGNNWWQVYQYLCFFYHFFF